MSVYSLLTTGNAVGEKLCYHDIPERLDPFDNEAFMASPTAFYVGVTNLETGQAEYPRITDMRKQMDYMRASASMPYVSVSYTHLDVYKRQEIYHCAIMSAIKQGACMRPAPGRTVYGTLQKGLSTGNHRCG